MKLQPLHIIAMLAAVIFAMFSIDTADVCTSSRSYRTYGYGREYGTRTATGDGPLTVMQDIGTESVRVSPQDVETVTENHCPLQIPNSELSTPPVALSFSAMTELSPVELPPLDAGMVNVTGGFDENMQTAGYRVKPMPGEFAIAVPYDPALLPQGFTEDDIQTYVYDRQYRRWIAIPRDSVNTEALLVCSRFRPWGKGLPHTQDAMASPQDALAQAQGMMSLAAQGEGGGESPLDFINAVLKTPEMPETSAYTPTSIKELKAADPLEGLTLMQPPTANNSGTANLSYPIEIPAGRQGMQPNLVLTYSSSGGNGWLGVGWDISIPSITVETRWGVPRYDPGKESEVYVYEGEQLVSYDSVSGRFREMPHRTNQWTNRSTLGNVEQFYPRRNEAFDSIVRHGSDPGSYWWTVTHKNGVTDYYGKYASDNGVNSSCVLRAGSSNHAGPIAHWALAESVDPYGNSVRYYYSIEYDRGFQNSSTPGRQIYIDSIRYTGKGDDPGKYKIVFAREKGREDVIVSANRGLKEVTASTLCKIGVCFDSVYFRHYMFLKEYGRNSNFKTRLTDVIAFYDPSDTLLSCDFIPASTKFDFVCTHFDYFDLPDTAGMFGDPVGLSLRNDTVKSTFITAGGIAAKATALGGTRGKSWNIGGTATVGVGPVVPLTTVSVGGNFNYSRSKSEGALTLIDLDGDGLADKVYKKGKKLYYRRHIADSEYRFHFDPQERELKDYSDPANPQIIKDFLSEVSSTTTWGLQLSLGLAYSGSWPTTKSTTSVYFADVNADGLPDLVTDGGVLFNVTERDGVVKFRNFYTIAAENIATGSDSTFVHTSTDTCGGIIFDGAVSDSVVCQTEWKFYMSLWPKVFYHNQYGDLSQLLCYADSLERTGNYLCRYIYSDSLPGHLIRIDIYKKTKVSCSPFPTSTSSSDILERDPDLEAVKVWVAPEEGVVDIISDIRQVQDSTTSFLQSRTRDGMSYALQLCKSVEADTGHRLSASTSLNTFILASGGIGEDDNTVHHDSVRVPVVQGDLVFFRLISGENHDYDNVQWDRTIRYTGASGKVYNAASDFVLSGDRHFGAGAPGNQNKIGMTVNITTGSLGPSYHDTLKAVVVDTNGNVLHNKEWFCLLQSGWTNHIWDPLHDSSSTIHVNQSERVIFTLSSDRSNFPWENVRVTPHIAYYVKNANGQYDTIDCYPQVTMLMNTYDGTLRDTVYHRLFGPLYKGWGQFAYNNNDTLSDGTVVHDEYIRLEKLVADWGSCVRNVREANKTKKRLKNFQMDSTDSTEVRESSDMVNLFTADTLYNPLSFKTSWVEMQPDFQHQAWVGYGNVNFVTRETMCNTRMPGYYTDSNTVDIEDYDHPVPVVAGHDVKTVRKQNYSKMRNHSLSLSVPMVPFSMGTSVSKGYNLIVSDYMDMNGDRYPDILGPSQVQYSEPWGGIGDVRPLGLFDDGVTRSETGSNGFNFGGSFEIPSRGASNNPKNSKISFNGAGSAGANLGGGKDSTSLTWMDMNADGLPDKVLLGNGTLKVCLNTGYSFLDVDTWNVSFIRKGESRNLGMNIGGNFNIGQASIGGGIGVNFSKNMTGKMLMDFNGDGFPDIVWRDTTGDNPVLRVRYAKGNSGWSGWESFPALTDISFGRSFSESVDVSVTVGFTFLSIIKLCVGISGSPYNRTFSKDSIQITDINGDGYVDYVTSNREDSMTVRYNQSGKTNLLRKVTNFTGSTFELDYDMPLACYDKPQRSWNLCRVETRNNVDTCPVGGNRTLTTFEYNMPAYNRHERMDYGYGTVITKQYNTNGGDTLYRYTVEEYNNRDFTKRGRKTRDCVYDAAGRPYIEHLYNAIVNDFADSVVTDGGCARADVYVKNEVDITNWYEGDPSAQITSVVQREYDRHRNVVRYTHRGDTTHHDEWFKAEIDYATGMSHNLTGLPVRIVVKNHSGDTLQKRTASYFSTGKLQQLVLHNSTGPNAQYDFTYDTCGNLAHSKHPQNDSLQRLEFNYRYDSVVHTYPVRVENVSLGWHSTAEYDYRFGKPTKTVDINGNEMWYEYDRLGRMVTVTAPYEIDENRPYTIRMEYHPHNFMERDVWTNSTNPYSYARTYHYDPQHSDNDITTTVIADGLGRLMQTKKDAEIGGQEVSLVTGRVTYDCFCRTVGQYHPFTEPLGTEGTYNDSLTAGTATVTEYDIMDRQTRVTQPYGYVTSMDYGFGTWGGKTLLRTATTDPNGNTTTVLCGTMGQRIRQVQPGNTTTRFEYDCLGRLIRSRDPDGFVTEYEYDMLGRMTHRHHPDAGDDWYSYDPAGNLIQHKNAASEGIIYRYHYSQLKDVVFTSYPEANVHYEYGTSAYSNVNAVGKVILQEDGSGWQMFKYGKLGEVKVNIRTFALPFEAQTYTFTMAYKYDSWNRIQKMSYPDGEVVEYGYDRGGMLNCMTSNKNDILNKYIDSIRYNHYGLKDTTWYGNGTWTEYQYDTLLRLNRLRSHTSSSPGSSEIMQDIVYDYDSVSNITEIYNSAGQLANGLGGSYLNQYQYDNLYRLTEADGWWGSPSSPYHLQMNYYPNGRIDRKQLSAVTFTQAPGSNSTIPLLYDRIYYYTNNSQPNTLTRIGRNGQHQFVWDAKGNMTRHVNSQAPYDRYLCWDEQNRLLGVIDNHSLSYYIYDAEGDRVYKLTGERLRQNLNGERSVYYQCTDATLYASPYVIATSKGYTKHYYAENERVASKIGGGRLHDLNMQVDSNMFHFHEAQAEKRYRKIVEDCLNSALQVGLQPLKTLYQWYDSIQPENDCYWYHPDHLGSSSWITYSDGKAVQHLHYLPWGEDFINQRTTDYAARFTFSAKEKDAETGYSYFGARYYSSDLCIWLSVDPMSDKYPSLSPYVYCADNPVKLVDPNGEDIVILSSDGQNLYKYVDGKLFNAKTKEEYQGGDSFVDNAKSNLDKLSESKTGRTIIKDLQEAGYTATIFKNDAKSMFNTQEDGSSIGWKQSGDDVSTTGGLLANGTISLAHELIHSYDHKHGGDMGKDETNASIYEGLPRCEWIAVYHENAIRQELFGNNASLRDYYSKSNDSFTAKGTGPKLLDANNRPRLAKGISPLF